MCVMLIPERGEKYLLELWQFPVLVLVANYPRWGIEPPEPPEPRTLPLKRPERPERISHLISINSRHSLRTDLNQNQNIS